MVHRSIGTWQYLSDVGLIYDGMTTSIPGTRHFRTVIMHSEYRVTLLRQLEGRPKGEEIRKCECVSIGGLERRIN